VGAGHRSVEVVESDVEDGADKVAIDSAAVENPDLIGEAARAFGSQCIVLAVDARKIGDKWYSHTAGGTKKTDLDLYDWVVECEDRGAGEILFTSMDHDGTKQGFAIEALQKVNSLIKDRKSVV